MPNSDLVSTAEAASALGVLPRTVARWVAKGKLLPALKLPGETGAYLFDREDIEALADDSDRAAS